MIIGICCLLYVIGWTVSLEYFALRPDHVLTEQGVIALFSHQFLHGSWFHLLGNMYFLYILGDNIEDVLGWWRYLSVYLACGIVGALVHILANPGDAVPLVGASGAISGIMAAYFLLFRNAKLTFMFLFKQLKVP